MGKFRRKKSSPKPSYRQRDLLDNIPILKLTDWGDLSGYNPITACPPELIKQMEETIDSAK